LSGRNYDSLVTVGLAFSGKLTPSFDSMKICLIPLVGLLILPSCDCIQEVSGTVVDATDGKPIEQVTVYKKGVEIKSKTDRFGNFKLSEISGGFSCPPMRVVLEAPNYKTVEVEIPAGGEQLIKMQLRGSATPK
jgi:hypothetical protein